MSEIRRATLAWLEQASPRLVIPIRTSGQPNDLLEISFVGITPALTAAVSAYALNVHADWQDETWDMLIAFDANPREIAGGCVCDCCDPDARAVFPDMEALWRDHLFEPFLEWVNTKLVPAEFLCLYGTRGHSTWARLESGNGFFADEPTIRIPLRS